MKKLHYNTIDIQEKSVKLLLAIIFVLVAVYCSLLISVVFSVIEQKQNNIASINISSNLTTLENKYASKIATFDYLSVSKLDFVHINSTSFAVRKDKVASYSFLYEH